MNYFVTGTDTGVGKTFVTALLVRALRKTGLNTVALKPICCGSREDVHILRAASGGELSMEEMNPQYFDIEAAPLAASRNHLEPVNLDFLAAWFQSHRAQRQSLLVEGAGGWMTPLAAKQTMADLAGLFQLPVLIVVPNRLGCINHTLLTVENIRSRGLECAGLILNSMEKKQSLAARTNRENLQEACAVPILFEIHPGQQALELDRA